jgi:hypothetical protein
MTAIVQQGDLLKFVSLLTARLEELYQKQPLPSGFHELSVDIVRSSSPGRMSVLLELEGAVVSRLISLNLRLPFDYQEGTVMVTQFAQKGRTESDQFSEADQLNAKYERTLYFAEDRDERLKDLINVTDYLAQSARRFFGLGILPERFDPKTRN